MSKGIERIIRYDGSNLELGIELLMHDIVSANIYNKLISDLVGALEQNTKLYAESRTFWFLALESLKESRMIRLARIVDSEQVSVSIVNMLECVRACRGLFSREEFVKRLKKNPFVESLAEHDRSINLEELEADIASINDDEIVKKIRKWRNVFLAHKGLKSGLNKFQELRENGLSYEEISVFLKKCHTVVNKYLNLFKAATWTDSIVGGDDFKGLVRFFNLGMETYEKNLQSRMEELGTGELGQGKTI